MFFYLIAKALFVLEIFKLLSFFPGWPAIYAMNNSRTFQEHINTFQKHNRS